MIKSVFTTAGLPADARFEAWRESIDVIFDVRPAFQKAPEFNAHVESFLLGDLILVRCTANGQKFDRAALRIARDGIDHYMIQAFLVGRTEVRRGSRMVTADASGLIGFDFAEVLDSRNDDFDVLSLFVPRRLLSPLLRHPDAVHGRVLPHRGLALLARDYLISVYQSAPALSAREAQVAVETLLPLIAGALNGLTVEDTDRPELGNAIREAVLIRAKRYIEGHLDDLNLSADAIAAAIATSRAQLYRVFEPFGGVQTYIRQRRLFQSLRWLASPEHDRNRITDIAIAAGFSSVTDFGRAFKKTYGITPREARQLSYRRQEYRIGDAAGEPCDRQYEQWIVNL